MGRQRTSDAQINAAIELIKTMHNELGRMPYQSEYNARKGDLPHSQRLAERYDGWKNMVIKLGYASPKKKGANAKDKRLVHYDTGQPWFDLIATAVHLARIDIENGYDYMTDRLVAKVDKDKIDDPESFLEFMRREFEPLAMINGHGKEITQ